MKLIAISLLVSIVFTISLYSQDNVRTPTIHVTGIAEIMVPPDEVVFSLDVTKRNEDMKAAKNEADEVLRKVIELTRRFNIKPENVKTDYISVEKRYQSIRDPARRVYDEDGDEIVTKVFLGYDVSTTVTVKLTELSNFEQFFSEVINTGISEIGSVKFNSSEIIEQRKKAREMAMKAAYEKAAAMAGAIGQSVGKAIYIAEGTIQDPRASSGLSNTISTYGGPVTVTEPVATFSPGAIRVASQVTVTFLLN